MLVQIAHVYGDEDKGGKKEKLLDFFNMVIRLAFSQQRISLFC